MVPIKEVLNRESQCEITTNRRSCRHTRQSEVFEYQKYAGIVLAQKMHT